MSDKEPVIEIRDLRMKYGSKEVLKGINLQVTPGQIIGYIGPNGAGKSTTVKIMLGLVEGYRGSIRLFGEDITPDSYHYKKRLGYVPENAELYDNLTPHEYMTFIGGVYGLDTEAAERKALALMKLLEIGEAYNARISTLSKGMKQKLLLISSLIHNPDILFLDEPLSGLDANSVLVVKEVLYGLAKAGKTVFYSSHIMDVVEKISDRIVIIHDGQIIADGSFEELKVQSTQGSLESIFNQLTGFSRHHEIAEEFIYQLTGVRG